MRHIKDVCEKIAREFEVELSYHEKEPFDLDRIIDKKELCGSKLMCIVARPGVGKTTLALDFILPEAIEMEQKALIFSAEKSAKQMVYQFIMKISGMNLCLMRGDLVSSQRKAELCRILAFLSSLEIYIEDFQDQENAELSYVEQMVSSFEDVGLVLLDGLYCFWMDAKCDKLSQKYLTDAMVKVKALSKKQNVPIVITTYMSRSEIRKTYNGNVLDNVFFKSGADLLLVLHKAILVNPEAANPITDLLIVNKSGNYTKESLYYDTKHRRFLNIVG